MANIASVLDEDVVRSVTDPFERGVWRMPETEEERKQKPEVPTENGIMFISHQAPVMEEPYQPDKFVVIKNESTAKPAYQLLGKWHCYVTEIGPDTFKATGVDVMNSTDDLDVEFDKSEVAPGDLSLLHEGAIFYWSIFYLDMPSGTRSRQSELYFRRYSNWDSKYIEHAKRMAGKLDARINWSKSET